MANDFVNDVNELNLNDVEQVDWSAYEDAAERKVTPQPGRFDLQLPDTFKYKKGREGQLVIQMDPLTIVDGPHKGFQIRFAQVSTKKMKNTNASQAGDVLRNLGSVAQPSTGKDWAEAFEDLAGSVAVKVECVYSGWDKVNQKQYDQKDFPILPDGTIQPFIDLPILDVEGNPVMKEDGSPQTRRVWGNLTVAVRGFAIKKEKK
jgi:hypothetical protein